jgi:electron transport complex protein RnfB
MSCKTCIDRCPTDARTLIDGRIVVAEERCIGCGLCVTTCPGGANAMRPREKKQKIPGTHRDLYTRIGREAILSIIK